MEIKEEEAGFKPDVYGLSKLSKNNSQRVLIYIIANI